MTDPEREAAIMDALAREINRTGNAEEAIRHLAELFPGWQDELLTPGERRAAAEMEEEAAQWQQREVELILPMSLTTTMWTRAQRWEASGATRFDVEADNITLWSLALDDEASEPNSTFRVRWGSPTPEDATIYRLAWNPVEGGSEEQVWRAMELLAGRPLR